MKLVRSIGKDKADEIRWSKYTSVFLQTPTEKTLKRFLFSDKETQKGRGDISSKIVEAGKVVEYERSVKTLEKTNPESGVKTA